MGRDREVLNPVKINFYVEKEDYEEFNKIALREHGGNKSKLGQKMTKEYNKNHAEGNDTFKITEWTKDSEFQAVPAYYRDKDTWINHYKNASEKDRTQLRIRALDFTKWFRMVDMNENRK